MSRSGFFFRVLDLTAENNPPISGRKKTLSVRRTLRACLAGASAPGLGLRPDVWLRTCTDMHLYARALCENPAATLDDLREAVTTLEDVERTARRVLGGNHPFTMGTEDRMRIVRAALRARETPQEV